MKIKLFLKFKILLIVLFSVCLYITSFAQSIEQTYAFANQQLLTNEYENAIKAYQRVMFFDTSKQLSNVYQNIAECYLQIENFTVALNYYDLAYNSCVSDSVKNELVFKKTLCNLKSKDYYLALAELMRLSNSLSDYFEIKKNFYTGVTYFGLNNYDLSEKNILTANLSQESTEAIKLLYEKIRKTDRINPKTAKSLSMILPGLGQLYCGDYKNAINSFALTTGFLLIAVSTAINYSILDAFLAVMPWYQRYYWGGFKNAEIIAIKKIEFKKNKYFQEIIMKLQDIKY